MPLSNAQGAFRKQIYADLFVDDQYAFGIYYPSSISAHDATAHSGLSQHKGVDPFHPNQTTNAKSSIKLQNVFAWRHSEEYQKHAHLSYYTYRDCLRNQN